MTAYSPAHSITRSALTSSACGIVYGEPLYTEATTLAAEKSVSMSFRVCPTFNALLEIAAARESRRLTSTPETLDFAHSERRELSVPLGKVREDKESNI